MKNNKKVSFGSKTEFPKDDVKPTDIEIAVAIAMNKQMHILERRLYKGISKQIFALMDKIDGLKGIANNG